MKNNKNGYLLPMVIIYMIITMIVGAGILVLGSLDRIEANKRLHREQAFYLAEAGINLARFNLKNNSLWTPDPGSYSLDTGSFQLQEIVQSDTILVISTGTVNGITEKTSLTVTKGGGAFSRGLFGNSGVNLDYGGHGSTQVSGYDSRTGLTANASVVSNSSVVIAANGRIFGDVSVPPPPTGTITYPAWSPGAITGNQSTNATPWTPPNPVTIPSALLSLSYAQQGGVGLSGNYQVINGGDFTMTSAPRNASITAGSYHFKSLTLTSDAALTFSGTGTVQIYIDNALSVTNNSNGIVVPLGTLVTIYMGAPNGSVTIGNSANINYNNSPENLAIYVASNQPVQMIGNCLVNAAIYAPNSTFTISNSSALRGGVVAKQVNLEGNAQIYYDVALQSVRPPGDPGGGTPKFINWTKPDWKIK